MQVFKSRHAFLFAPIIAAIAAAAFIAYAGVAGSSSAEVAPQPAQMMSIPF